ncbi:MAG: protein kinase [Elusimicrobiota bacterium]
MNALLLSLLVLIPRPALSASAEYDQALRRVKTADYDLNHSYGQYQDAQSETSRVNESLQWKLFRSKTALFGFVRRNAKDDALSLRQRYKAATALADQKDAESKAVAKEYLAAEEEFKDIAGSYYKADQVGFWKERLAYSPPSEVQDALEPNADPQKSLERMRNLSKELSSGKGGLGGMVESTQLIGKLGDQLLDQTLQKDWGAEKAAPGTGQLAKVPRSFSSAGPGQQGSSSAAGITDKAILISPQRGDSAPRTSPAVPRNVRADPQTALRQAEKAVAANPKDAVAWLMKAQALNKLRRFSEAEGAARRALALRPNDPDALKSLIWAQLHQKKYKEAEANANALILLTPDDPQAYLLRAFARENLNDRKGMLRDLERAAELDPQRYGAHLALAKSGSRLFDPGDADSEALLEALALVPVRRGNPFIGIGVSLVFMALAGFLWTRRRKTAAPMPRSPEGSRTPRPKGETVVPPAVVPGALIANKYRMGRRMAEDDRGCTWEASDVTLGRSVLIRQASKEQGDAGLFRKEAQALAALHHPHILEFYEFLDTPRGYFWVFERAPSMTLRQMLSRHGRLGLPQAKAVVGGVGHALAFAHSSGITHRCLGPDCILITDRAIAKLTGFSPFDFPRPRPETQPYRAPETLKNTYLPASDVYSLAACLYEMLSGEAPKPERLPLAGRFGLAPSVDALLDSALESDPEERLNDPLELFNRL